MVPWVQYSLQSFCLLNFQLSQHLQLGYFTEKPADFSFLNSGRSGGHGPAFAHGSSATGCPFSQG